MKFRKQHIRKGGLGTALDITPIVDMVFNLLIFFAVSLNFAATSGGINVKLPEASTAEPIRAEQFTINLTKDGKTYLNDRPVTLNELKRELSANQDKQRLVIILADNKVHNGRVVQTMDIIKTSGFNKLAIAVDKGPPPVREEEEN